MAERQQADESNHSIDTHFFLIPNNNLTYDKLMDNFYFDKLIYASTEIVFCTYIMEVMLAPVVCVCHLGQYFYIFIE